MNFRKTKNKPVTNEKGEKYEQHRLLFYKEPPSGEISLEQFENFAVDRLKLLREIENINIRFKRNSDEYEKKMKAIVKEFLPYDTEEKMAEVKAETFKVKCDKQKEETLAKNSQQQDRTKDNISHFILRLAFARSEDLRRWFLTQEMDLFRFRFQDESNQQKDIFMKQNDLKFDAVPPEEKTKDLLKKLQHSKFINATIEAIEEETYYKVPFSDVLDLVKNRRVYLHQGYAYVPQEELVSIIIGIYRTQLSQALAVTARKLPYLEEDTRLLPMLKNLSSAYIGDAYTSKKSTNEEKLDLKEIDEASKLSYPICMRNLHEGLRKDHHLKHFGRLQYGLFIKATGLSLEEALIFWRTEFTKKMDVDKFEKQHAYGIRHSYGKEGKRVDYTPYSCLKIITSNQPSQGDFHGCPFKHSDADVLQRRLQSYKVPKETANEIVDLVKRQHFQVACARYFEVTHKLTEGTVSINHPNEYFLESRRVLKNGTSSTSNIKQEIKKDSKTSINNVKDEGTKVSSNPSTNNKIESDMDNPSTNNKIESDMDFNMDEEMEII